MKHEIIKTENCLLVVDDSEIKEGDYRLNIQRNTIHFVDEEPSYFNKRNDVFKKIIAHLPLNNSPILEGVDLLPPLEDDIDEAEKEFTKLFGGKLFTSELISEVAEHYFIVGFKEAKEKYKYTEEDMIKAAKYGYEFRDTTSFPEHKFEDSCINNTKQWLQSLQQPKIPVAFESDIEDLKMLKNRAGGVTFFGKPKTTTNSQGLTQLLGEYQY